MKIRFNIHFTTTWGQNMHISGSIPQLGMGKVAKSHPLTYKWDENTWTGTVEVSPRELQLEYKYLIVNDMNGSIIWEGGENRTIDLSLVSDLGEIVLNDNWREQDLISQLFTNRAFANTLFKRALCSCKKAIAPKRTNDSRAEICFRIAVPIISPELTLAIIGSDNSLGAWDEAKAVVMKDNCYPLWQANVFAENPDISIEYKYVVYDTRNRKIITWEDGENRVLLSSLLQKKHQLIVRTDENFRYSGKLPKFRGLQVPLSQISCAEKGYFSDFGCLHETIELAAQLGMKLVKVSPFFATASGFDGEAFTTSASASMYGIDHLYLSINSLAKIEDEKIQSGLEKEYAHLTSAKEIDYLKIAELKKDYAWHKFNELVAEAEILSEIQNFVHENQTWLAYSSVFYVLRETYQTGNFINWPENSKSPRQIIDEYWKSDHPENRRVQFYCYLQYLLYQQLQEVCTFARSKGVVLQCTLPFAMHRFCAENWFAPQYFSQDGLLGFFSEDADNQEQTNLIPYNWTEIQKYNYRLISDRARHLRQFFDSIFLENISGYFRSWELPLNNPSVYQGFFNPAVPLTKYEIEGRGIHLDFKNLNKPNFTKTELSDFFKDQFPLIIDHFFAPDNSATYFFKPQFQSLNDLRTFISWCTYFEMMDKNALFLKLQVLWNDILFVVDKKMGTETFYPRFKMAETITFQRLSEPNQIILMDVYDSFYNTRNIKLWRDLGEKIIKSFENCLLAGEDKTCSYQDFLSVFADNGVLMDEFLLGCTQNYENYVFPEFYPYISMASISSGQLPLPENWAKTSRMRKKYVYNQLLGHNGQPPEKLDNTQIKEIIQLVIESPSVFSVVHLADLLSLTKNDLAEEKQANTQIDLIKLQKNKDLIDNIRKAIS
jgi:4-alpha-glucanotransferase